MKIYFAGSIRGGRNGQRVYRRMIEHMRQYGRVLTEHVGAPDLSDFGDDRISDQRIYERDMSWLREADILVAEVSTPSLGVGYEIAKAEEQGKPVLCLYRERRAMGVSAMITGNRGIRVEGYQTEGEAFQRIDRFLSDPPA